MLEVREIYKTFNAGTINEKRAMNGVTLTLNEGDFATVIGGNGAGKSTLLNLVAGVYPLTPEVAPVRFREQDSTGVY